MTMIFPGEFECCGGMQCGECVCGDVERVLRNYAAGKIAEPMTLPQREWCLAEAEAAGEGLFERKNGRKLSDVELAKWVLAAWGRYAERYFLV